MGSKIGFVVKAGRCMKSMACGQIGLGVRGKYEQKECVGSNKRERTRQNRVVRKREIRGKGACGGSQIDIGG